MRMPKWRCAPSICRSHHGPTATAKHMGTYTYIDLLHVCIKRVAPNMAQEQVIAKTVRFEINLDYFAVVGCQHGRPDRHSEVKSIMTFEWHAIILKATIKSASSPTLGSSANFP